LGTLHCLGVPMDWSALYPVREPADLPTTAWQHRRYWADAGADADVVPHEPQRHDVDGHTVLGRHTLVQGTSSVALWQTRIDNDSRPYPGGHKVLGAEIIPAAVVLTTFLGAVDGARALTDVALRVPLALTMPRDVQVVRQDGAVRLSSRPADQANDQSWLTHATARVADTPGDDGRPGPVLECPAAEELDPECVMDRLRAIGVVGIGFPWQVREVRRSANHILARVAADPDRLMSRTTWASLIDAGLSTAPIVFPGAPRLRMPGLLREVTVHGDPPDEALIGVRLAAVQWGERDQADDVEVDVMISGLDGAVLALMSGVRFGVVRQAAVPEADSDDVVVHAETEWCELTAPELRDYVDAAVRNVVAGELRLDPSDLDAHRPLPEMGVDSLLGESIRQRLNRQFRTALPSSLLWDRPSAASVASYLVELVASSKAADEERSAA
jgi:hypothetical protein